MQPSRAIKISIHQVVKVSALYGAVVDQSCWVELTTTDLDGGTFSQTIFFDDPQVAKAYAEAINSVVPMISAPGLARALPLQRVCGND